MSTKIGSCHLELRQKLGGSQCRAAGGWFGNSDKQWLQYPRCLMTLIAVKRGVNHDLQVENMCNLYFIILITYNHETDGDTIDKSHLNYIYIYQQLLACFRNDLDIPSCGTFSEDHLFRRGLDQNCGGIGDLHHIANVEISDRCFVDLSLRQKFSPHPTGQGSSEWIGVKFLPFRSTSDCFFCPAPPGMVTGGTCKIHHPLTI